MADFSSSYLLNNPNSYTMSEVSDRAAANQVFAALNPTSSYTPLANSYAQSYTDALNSWVKNNGGSNNGVLSDIGLKDWLEVGKLGLNGITGVLGYLSNKKNYNLIKDQMAQSAQQFNETYNNQLKQLNESRGDRLTAAAAFNTGNQHAYDDRISSGSYTRGNTASSGSDVNNYIAYKQSANQ